jgi:SagB-type dehydrogenase family enzyme
VEGLEAGVYRYLPRAHSLRLRSKGDLRHELADAALGQRWIAEAPASIIVCGDPGQVSRKYGRRGAERYLFLDAGAAAENILLQIESLGLGATPVGAFRDEQVQDLVADRGYVPLLIIPAGFPE